MPDHVPAVGLDIDQIPVEPGVEAGRQAGGDVGGEHRVGKKHGVVAPGPHHIGQDIDPRLRERRVERVVIGHVHLGGAEAPQLGRQRLDPTTDQHRGHLILAEGHGF